MAKAKTAEEKVKAAENGQQPVQPWQIQTLVDKQVYEYLPALFEAMKSIHEELVQIKKVLEEK